jgi:hypothetical protein
LAPDRIDPVDGELAVPTWSAVGQNGPRRRWPLTDHAPCNTPGVYILLDYEYGIKHVILVDKTDAKF